MRYDMARPGWPLRRRRAVLAWLWQAAALVAEAVILLFALVGIGALIVVLAAANDALPR